ncbi:hypothetical protein J2755_001772 [Methanohalophilus levihalophilus]|uniref:hypothetical protein n=1 Tax=Methanohalophilus levihalophilus TaxID=1431282 RepID=UPI001AE3CDF7|nr:hypothetical protein [Methanohalophilus levihalophilus]MBP2030824.1 hypothetical protein [Methanohalophilus levihalophilus]
MGHSAKSADFYTQFDEEISMFEYLKGMKWVTISAAAEAQHYKNTEHQREIEYLDKKINLVESAANVFIEELSLSIDGDEYELREVENQLENNDMLSLADKLTYKQQKRKLEDRISRGYKTLENKKNDLKIELEQLEYERQLINEKYKQAD